MNTMHEYNLRTSTGTAFRRERERKRIIRLLTLYSLTLTVRSPRLVLVRCHGNLRNELTRDTQYFFQFMKESELGMQHFHWQVLTMCTMSNTVQPQSSLRDAEAFHTLTMRVPTCYKARAWRNALKFHVLHCEETSLLNAVGKTHNLYI